MKRCYVLLLLVSIGIFSNCGSSSKRMATGAEEGRLDALIGKKSYEIISDRALPMATNALNSIANAGLFPPGSSAGQINLIGNSNYLRVMGDSVSVYLPYFGERQMGGGYNNGTGIEYNGIPKSIKINKDADKNLYDIQFKIKNTSESFNVRITLFANLSSMVYVNGTQRFPIRYSGRVESIPTGQ